MFGGYIKVKNIVLRLPHYQVHFIPQSEISLPSDGFFFSTCWSRGTSESSIYEKQQICPCNSALAHFHVSWLQDFILYPKPLYKSLHQSFFYSFITILPSESGVTLHYNTILPQILLFRHLTSILLFRHLTSIFESTNAISRY